jgi:hypothetical protein
VSTTGRTTAEVLEALAGDAEIPVISGCPVAQGDLILLPADGLVPEAVEPVPAEGVVLLRGRGGHAHLLLGRVRWAPGPPGAQTIGTITVPDGETGYLAHGDGTPPSALSGDAEHSVQAFACGTWVARRQREQAEDERLIID